jgi:hypothetical protein
LTVIVFAYWRQRKVGDLREYTADFSSMLTTAPSALEMLSIEIEADVATVAVVGAICNINEIEMFKNVKCQTRVPNSRR